MIQTSPTDIRNMGNLGLSDLERCLDIIDACNEAIIVFLLIFKPKTK
jgi:hypothetical protein